MVRRYRAIIEVKAKNEVKSKLDALRHLIFRPLRAVPEKSALLETRQFSKPIAALRLPQRTFLPMGQKGSNLR